MGIRENLGKIAPLMKWSEYLKSFISKFNLPTPSKSWIDDTMIPLLSDIERFGVRVDGKKFIDRYPQATKHLKDNILYTEYNPYTITSRPSNRFGGINFSALNKKDGTREVFIPKENHIFLQMDFDAYHPRIIGKLTNYDLPKTSVHQWLAEQYGCSYEESKGITFQLLYGGIPDEFDEIPYYFSTRVADIGEEVFALGYPLTNYMGKDIKFTDGKISSKTGYDGDIANYQTTTPIQPGNSGGPLFDYEGNLIAINAARFTYENSQNVSYSIKSTYLKNLIDVLPVNLILPHNKDIRDLKLTEKIKVISDYVVLIKIK